jgi:K+-transporting ATPase ATPase C chain
MKTEYSICGEINPVGLNAFEAEMQHIHRTAVRKLIQSESQSANPMKTIIQSIRIVIILTLLTGAIYPLAVTVVARVAFPNQANGSLIKVGGKIAGSALLAQKFEDPEYFWPRPSGADYTTVASGATNKGPISADLVKAIEDRRKTLGDSAPVDLLTASGSGLDPHISPESARFQVERIAQARKLNTGQLNALVDQSVEPPQFGVLGEARVNVLILNLALDRLH